MSGCEQGNVIQWSYVGNGENPSINSEFFTSIDIGAVSLNLLVGIEANNQKDGKQRLNIIECHRSQSSLF